MQIYELVVEPGREEHIAAHHVTAAEVEDEFTEVNDVQFVMKTHKKPLTLRLEEHSLNELKTIAREKGIGPSTLARMWILERLRAQRQPGKYQISH